MYIKLRVCSPSPQISISLVLFFWASITFRQIAAGAIFFQNQACKSLAESLRPCPDDFEGQKIASVLIAWAENLIGHQAFQ
jgi:hypothetical protein